jgi:putative adhesin
MARPLLALGGIVLIGVGLATAFGWGWGSNFENTHNVSQTIRSVKLEGDSGSVKIRTGSGQPTVQEKVHYNWRSKPSGDFARVEGDQLVLADCGNNCTVDFEVVVPAGVPVTGKLDSGGLDIAGVSSVDVQADSGHARVEDVSGAVKLRLESGSIDLRNVGEVQLHADSGHVQGNDVRGPVDVTSSSGSVELSLTQETDVKVKSDSGSVEVKAPGGPYRVQGDSDSGHRDIDVPTDGSGRHVLDLTTDSGSVTVRAA